VNTLRKGDDDITIIRLKANAIVNKACRSLEKLRSVIATQPLPAGDDA
jgi:hypothetical protein